MDETAGEPAVLLVCRPCGTNSYWDFYPALKGWAIITALHRAIDAANLKMARTPCAPLFHWPCPNYMHAITPGGKTSCSAKWQRKAANGKSGICPCFSRKGMRLSHLANSLRLPAAKQRSFAVAPRSLADALRKLASGLRNLADKLTSLAAKLRSLASRHRNSASKLIAPASFPARFF